MVYQTSQAMTVKHSKKPCTRP